MFNAKPTIKVSVNDVADTWVQSLLTSLGDSKSTKESIDIANNDFDAIVSRFEIEPDNTIMSSNIPVSDKFIFEFWSLLYFSDFWDCKKKRSEQADYITKSLITKFKTLVSQ
ncbi:hypothetical protein MM5_212 [Morganella phage vB_Mm5]